MKTHAANPTQTSSKPTRSAFQASRQSANRAAGELAGRVAVITGGAQGIGQATAFAFARAGADIAFTCHGSSPASRARARSTAAKIRTFGRRVIFATADATDDHATEAFMARVVDELGHIDILVNNVGGADTVPPGGYADIPMSYWRQQFEKNFFSSVAYSRLAVKYMLLRDRGSIINISSIHSARIFNTRFIPYSCSKVAMNYQTRSLAVELAPHNIRVNCIAPGLIRTALTKRRYDAAWWAAVNDRIPMHRPGSPAEIGEVALFLASDRASYLTGQVIFVDGGGADGGSDL